MKNQQINFTLVVLIIILFLLFLLQFVHGFKPIIIIPGSGGSKLEAKLNKTSVNHWYCSMTSDWYTIWVSIPSLLPPAINCWIDNMMLTWNPITKLYSNNLGKYSRSSITGMLTCKISILGNNPDKNYLYYKDPGTRGRSNRGGPSI